MSTSSGGKANINWLKMAVIPLLLGVLGIVVWRNQSPSQTAPAVDTQPTPPASSIVAAPTSEKSTSPETGKQRRIAWPKFTTDQILATNPFHGSEEMRAALKPPVETIAAANAANADAKASEAESELAEIDPWSALVDSFKEGSIGVYIETSKGPALKIGSRLLHVGDQIGDRYRITEIRQGGIVVEAAPASK